MPANSPIAIFGFNRPIHLENCIQSLLKNPEFLDSQVHIFIDGPRSSSERNLVNQTVDSVKFLESRKNVKFHLSKKNLGLANSIIGGVTAILEESETVIVLEDDLEVSPKFLKYMNEALSKYSECSVIASISGYSYPLFPKPSSSFFLRGAESWGWATWKTRWCYFEPDAAMLAAEIRSKNLVSEFNLQDRYGYFEMLEDQSRGRNDSWAIRWHALCFLNNWLTLYPAESLVLNRGEDGTGTHAGKRSAPKVQFSEDLSWTFPRILEESPRERETLGNYLSATYPHPKPLQRLNSICKTYLRGFQRRQS
jgi:Glycosyl transferase family 2